MHGRVLVELQVYSSACQPSEDCGLFIIFYFEGGEGSGEGLLASGYPRGPRGAGGAARASGTFRALRTPYTGCGARNPRGGYVT